MSNAIVNAYSEFLLADLIASNIKIVLLDNTYTFSSAHDNLNDVGSGARVATSGNLASKDDTNGYFDSADVTFPSLSAGDTITQFYLYKDTGVESTSKLVAYFDTNAAAAAISVTTTGGDLLVQPSASGWLKI